MDQLAAVLPLSLGSQQGVELVERAAGRLALTEQADVLEMLVEGLGSNMSFAGWRIYGTDLGHRVEVRLWGNGELEVIARLDARVKDSDRFVRDICICAQALHCRLFSVDLSEDLEPDPDVVKEALRRSSAWRVAAAMGPIVH
ncbi:hypothetical protein ACNI65_21930 [Roseateles sp. So40a]|uniref:hypothetical protein n=1 Tax=Roseateles sp. So40a TaxID=3400226 RepID=UPI003A85F15C